MRTNKENWVKKDPADFKMQAERLVEGRKRWERDQIKQGKKETRTPLLTSPRAFIIKYI